MRTPHLLLIFLGIVPAEGVHSRQREQRRHLRSVAPSTRDSADHPPAWREDGRAAFYREGEAETAASVAIEVPTIFSKFMEGLMYRKSIDDNHAMLFQWAGNGHRSFWMENTYIDLDIVYVNVDKKISSIKQAHALDLASVPGDGLAKDAIELPMGWAEKHGIRAGDRVEYTLPTTAFFVARDEKNFGATDEEVAKAEADGTYDAFR